MKTLREFLNEAKGKKDKHQKYAFGAYEFDDSNSFSRHKHALAVAKHLNDHGFEAHVDRHNIRVGPGGYGYTRRNAPVVHARVKDSESKRFVKVLNSHPHIKDAYGEINHRDLNNFTDHFDDHESFFW